ncbi:unnamed protein product [Dibothriocephalus latus]|uniref:BTB domain-containing protein n=1 Tax=Dibothriocephalus latus TaxID=60516 RepID=A0A3P7R529_DIBLA|nr:unnamed protein product [Dibothriocephalus latus]
MSSAPFLTRDSKDVEHCDDIFAQLNELRKSGQLCDCVLAIGKFNFPAHKAVLVERIPFFADVFFGEAPKEDLMRVLRNIKPRYSADEAL